MSKGDFKSSTFIPEHSHPISEIEDLQDTLDAKADLDTNGKVLASQIPDFAKLKRVNVANQAARLALVYGDEADGGDIQAGDVAVQATPASLWWLLGDDPSDTADWEQINPEIIVPDSSDDIANDSSVVGVTVTNALETLDAELTTAEGDIATLQTDVAGKSDVGHTHPQSDITNLASDLSTITSDISDHESRITAIETDVLTSDDINNDSLVNAGAGTVSDALNYLDSNKQAQDDNLDEISAITENKGDLIVGTGIGWTDLAVGTNNQVLIVDSAQATGIKWGALPSHTHTIDSLSDVACSGGILDFGNSSTPVTTIFGGKGASDASPVAFGLRGTGGSGTNVAGGDLNLDAGPGTGNSGTGTGRLRATSAGSSGSTLQSSWINALTWGRSEVVLGLSLRTADAGISLNYQGSLAPASGGYAQLTGSNGIYFNAASVNRMLLTSSGLSVGHATTASAPLHVRGTSAQQIWEYSSGINATLTVDANGNLTINQTGEKLAIGKSASATANYAVALGRQAVAAGTYSVAIGLQCATNDVGSIAIGYLATPYGQLGVSIGSNSSSVSGGVALGYAATAAQGIALGNNSSCGGANQIAAGYAASTNDSHSVALGSAATSTGQFSAAIGGSSSAGTGGVALGYATAGGYGVALGYGSNAGYTEIALGSATHTKFGIFGTTPVGRGSAWSITNAAGARRTFDTSTVTLPQLAEVVATLLSHFGTFAGFGFVDTNY